MELCRRELGLWCWIKLNLLYQKILRNRRMLLSWMRPKVGSNRWWTCKRRRNRFNPLIIKVILLNLLKIPRECKFNRKHKHNKSSHNRKIPSRNKRKSPYRLNNLYHKFSLNNSRWSNLSPLWSYLMSRLSSKLNHLQNQLEISLSQHKTNMFRKHISLSIMLWTRRRASSDRSRNLTTKVWLTSFMRRCPKKRRTRGTT